MYFWPNHKTQRQQTQMKKQRAKKTKYPKMQPIYINFDGELINSRNVHKEVISIKTLIGKLNNKIWDLDIYFQRQPSWNLDMQANLIKSIMDGIPLGCCIIADKPKDVYVKNVIDFKNRCCAIKNFVENQFPILINLVDNDGKNQQKWLYWKDICSDNPKLANCREHFLDFNINVVRFSNLSAVEQAMLLCIINVHSPFSNEEILYGQNFWTKNFYQEVYDYALQNIRFHITANQEKNNKKEKGTLFVQRIMYICFGPDLEDSWAIRDMGNSGTRLAFHQSYKKPFVKASINFHNKIHEVLKEKEAQEFSIDLLIDSPWWEKVKILKKICDRLDNVLKYKNSLDKKILKNDLFDCIIFFTKKFLDKKLTFAMLDDNPSLYLNIITNYISQKAEIPALRSQSVEVKKLNERMSLFEKVWANFSIDDGIKNQKPTSVDTCLALLQSSDSCPITGEKLHEDNARIEHRDCKSKHSTTKFSVVSERGNRWKSNRTLDENEKVISYMKKEEN